MTCWTSIEGGYLEVKLLIPGRTNNPQLLKIGSHKAKMLLCAVVTHSINQNGLFIYFKLFFSKLPISYL
jgi:hypothetical protein